VVSLNNALNLFELSVENGHENDDGQAEEDECAEGQVPEYPHRRPRHNVGIRVEKSDTAGHEKNQPQYHKKDKHNLVLSIWRGHYIRCETDCQISRTQNIGKKTVKNFVALSFSFLL
jgi:hypothetical protein